MKMVDQIPEVVSKTETAEAEYLYKYYAFNDQNRQYIEKIFTHSQIYFASSRKFNDPFDSKVRPSFEGTKNEWRKKLRDIFKRQRPNWTKKQRFTEVERLLKSDRLKRIPEYITDSFLDKMGVFCMSEHRDDLLMWSHYSEGHTGFCLEFQATTKFFGRAQIIIYKERYPIFRFLASLQDELTEAMLLTKANVWKYEQERRAIDHKKGPGVYIFPEELLRGVIFGCRMQTDKRRIISEWCRKRRQPPKLYETRVKEGEFGLDIIAIDYP